MGMLRLDCAGLNIGLNGKICVTYFDNHVSVQQGIQNYVLD